MTAPQAGSPTLAALPDTMFECSGCEGWFTNPPDWFNEDGTILLCEGCGNAWRCVEHVFGRSLDEPPEANWEPVVRAIAGFQTAAGARPVASSQVERLNLNEAIRAYAQAIADRAVSRRSLDEPQRPKGSPKIYCKKCGAVVPTPSINSTNTLPAECPSCGAPGFWVSTPPDEATYHHLKHGTPLDEPRRPEPHYGGETERIATLLSKWLSEHPNADVEDQAEWLVSCGVRVVEEDEPVSHGHDNSHGHGNADALRAGVDGGREPHGHGSCPTCGQDAAFEHRIEGPLQLVKTYWSGGAPRPGPPRCQECGGLANSDREGGCFCGV